MVIALEWNSRSSEDEDVVFHVLREGLIPIPYSYPQADAP